PNLEAGMRVVVSAMVAACGVVDHNLPRRGAPETAPSGRASVAETGLDRASTSVEDPVADRPPGDQQERLDDDGARHLGGAPHAVGEADGHLDDAAPVAGHDVG